MYLKSPLSLPFSGSPLYRWRSGCRGLGALSVALVVAGFALTGCGGATSTRPTGQPEPSVAVSGVTPTSPGSSTGSAASDTVDAEAMSKRMTAALAVSGGCRVRVTIGTAKLTGSFALGKSLKLGAISEVRGQGQLTLGDGRSARYVALLGERPDRKIYVADGTPIGGRRWAEVPEMGMGLKEPEPLMKTHLLYWTAARAVPPIDPQAGARTVMDPVRTLGSEIIEGVSTTHYSWITFGGPAFDLWLDLQGRPTRFVTQEDGQPTSTVTYDRWGEQPAITQPPAADTTVLPVIDLG